MMILPTAARFGANRFDYLGHLNSRRCAKSIEYHNRYLDTNDQACVPSADMIFPLSMWHISPMTERHAV